jgi:formylglycine-generating enzyme
MRRAVLVAVLVAAAGVGAVISWWSQRPGAASAGATSAGAQTVAEHSATQSSCAPAPTNTAHPGMGWVPSGAFTMGSDHAFPEEGPAVAAKVEGFWMDQTEVTNAQFAQFVAATGYVTLAERGVRRANAADAPTVAGSAVFRPKGDAQAMRSFVNWWEFMRGANWRHPDGPGTTIEGREQFPVVHVAYEDALAYAKWKGHALPTEAQFEFAAQGSGRKNSAGDYAANSWQGIFPSMNSAADGHAGAAPVACYEPNKFGLHDLIGNVWEWTSSAYYERHDFAARAQHPEGFDPTQPDERAVAVLKGGSYLCAPDYCMRYRPEARIGQSKGLGTAHIGFRTVLNSP